MVSNKLFNIQYLRAIAAIFVLLFHTTNLIQQQFNYEYSYNIFRFGYMGVDLFFVISGFIISYIHYADFGIKSKVQTYFSKRLLRIFPVYWVVLLPVVIIHFLMPSFGGGYERQFTEILQSMFLVPQAHHPILDVAWTLRHEMLFYIIFGFLFIYNRSPMIFSTFIVLWAGMSTYSLLLNPHDPWLLFEFLFSPYNLEFLLGCFVAFIITKFKISFKLARASILIGLVLFLLSCSNEFLVYAGVNRVIKWGIPSALLIFGAVVFDIKAKNRPIKILNFIGDASYSIYLTHVPAIYFFVTIFNKLNLFNLFGYFTAVTLCIVLTLMGGCIFYQIIEKPVLKLARRIFRKKQTNTREHRTNPIFKST
jgi:exopolysaccharide production protein ExoZ